MKHSRIMAATAAFALMAGAASAENVLRWSSQGARGRSNSQADDGCNGWTKRETTMGTGPSDLSLRSIDFPYLYATEP